MRVPDEIVVEVIDHLEQIDLLLGDYWDLEPLARSLGGGCILITRLPFGTHAENVENYQFLVGRHILDEDGLPRYEYRFEQPPRVADPQGFAELRKQYWDNMLREMFPEHLPEKDGL